MSDPVSPVVILKRALKKDEKWLRFLDSMKTAIQPEFQGFIDEIMLLHKTRSIRVLGVDAAPSGKKIANAAMRDQSARSRCVEIAMTVTRSRNYLAIVMNTVENHINAEYGALLGRAGVRAMGERRAIVESLFGGAQRKLQEIDSIIEIADMVIKDCDQASFTLKHTVSALEVATAREKSY